MVPTYAKKCELYFFNAAQTKPIVIMAARAEGKRRANVPTPKSLYDNIISQGKRGGLFTQGSASPK